MFKVVVRSAHITLSPTVGVVLLVAGMGGLWLYWLAGFSWQISSDDALNFARGVERFSVLEFRPHFPGYPGMILGARLFQWVGGGVSAEQAVVLWTLLCALLIPVILAWGLMMTVQRAGLAVGCGALMYLSPVLAGIALSGLSDAPALLFFCCALCAWLSRRLGWLGWSLGLMLATRPAYAVLAVGLLSIVIACTPVRRRWEASRQLLVPVALLGAVSAAFVLAHDGVAYFAEGLRFTQGHFDIWGNTSGSEVARWRIWMDRLALELGWGGTLLTLIGLVCPWLTRNVSLKAISVVIAGYLVIMLLTQNPESFRHISPVLLVSLWLLVCSMGAATWGWQVGMLMLCLLVNRSLLCLDAPARHSPAEAAIRYLAEQAPQLKLGTNYHVNLIREKLPAVPLYDLYYPSHWLILQHDLHTTAFWRLSSQPVEGANARLLQFFPSRFPTERALYLYRYEPAKLPE